MKPPRLEKGDVIGVVAPASAFDHDNFKKGVAVLRGLGYKVVYEPAIFTDRWSRPGHNKQRAAQINRMFADRRVKAIVCAKAGHGSREILDYVDRAVVRANPKIFVGYSDITILLLCLRRLAGMVVFHGPVISGEFFDGMSPATIDSFVRLLGEKRPFGPVGAGGVRALRRGRAEGVLAGGNLSLVLQSVGTAYDIRIRGGILFIEEVDEPPAKIMDGLRYLRELGRLGRVSAIVLGRFTNCFADEADFLRHMRDFFKDAPYPVIYRVPAGHIEQPGDAHCLLPLGVRVRVDADHPALEIVESAVK